MAMTAILAPLAVCALKPALAADAPLVSPADPAARAVKYIPDASQAKGATPGMTCANCALYLGTSGSTQGPCQIFAGKQVKAAGWCSSWAPQM
jgi:hypothetical protein